ncbi:MAG: patatin-like phospholipase family protein, partial [Actinomycetota bacterium]|nr:patatin-like phospholipase family protein [Actinomycetota bacterium]
MRVGLVLGAGGVVGASWLIGALEGLEAETGWTGAEAERIVGTSAGSVIGALTAAGVSPELMGAYASGASLDGYAEAEARAGSRKDRDTGSEYRLSRSLPPLGPGSWRLIAGTLRHPRKHNPAAMLAGWLPRGFVSTAPIQRLVESYIHDAWPAHPSYWAVAADYATGRRTAFGSDGAPEARVGEAVAASCAIPGFYHPPRISGRRYVDGGICSNSNLDLLAGRGLDLVLCLNPMSSLVQGTGSAPADRVGALVRTAAGKRVGHEARKLREVGTKVLILQPGSEDIQLMGLNLMSGARRLKVMEQARRSVARELRGLRGR